MKKFLFITCGFIFALFVFFYIVFSQANGYTDAYYLRLATPKQSSLIIGTSRAAQGIKPTVINQVLNRNDLFNYAFTLGHSPYGPTYLNSIKNKLLPATKDGVFILAVDPWSISNANDDPNDPTQFREADLLLGTTFSVTSRPNIDYLIENYDEPYYKLLYNTDKTKLLHEDGWLEINVPIDEGIMNQRIQTKIKEYQDHAVNFKKSDTRLQYLNETIGFLKQHGEVYLVRLPVSPGLMEIEDQFMPEFNSLIEKLAAKNNSSYYNMSPLNADFIYTDGNHLYKDSSDGVSELIAKWILSRK